MPDVQSHYRGKTRRALRNMALAVELDPDRYGDAPEEQLRLWNDISQRISGGVQHTSEPVIGDPFAVFVTGICQDLHDGKGWHKQTAVVKTGAKVDQAEGERIISYLEAQENVNRCEICGGPITTWSTDNTRVSTFAAQNKTTAMPSSIIRGSDT